MRNVKWTTAGIVFSSTISLIVAGVWFCSDLKGDIKDGRIEAREQLTAAVTSINKKIDSNQRNNDFQFNDIWVVLNSRGVKHSAPNNEYGCLIEQVVNGKRIFRAVKCQ